MAGIWDDHEDGAILGGGNDDHEISFSNIDMKIAGISLNAAPVEAFNTKDSTANEYMGPSDAGYKLDNEDEHPDFEFDKLLKGQYVEVSDYDFHALLDLLMRFPNLHPHMTTYPAAFIFQCIRYMDHKLKSPSMVEQFVDLSLTRILSSIDIGGTGVVDETTTNTPSPGVAGKTSDGIKSSSAEKTAGPKGDIIVQSYWFNSLAFLHFYFCKEESFYRRYPNILQELIDALHSVMVQLISSIHTRLCSQIDQTILEYTTIEDVRQKLYKSDWNFFKKRKQAKNAQNAAEKSKDKSDNLYYDDDVLKHLYPPTLEEQMIPSPMKIVQIFGALLYVLELHSTHPLYQQQCLSMAIQWFSSTLFNKILKDRSKKCLSRAHAIQIRLNLNTLDTWIKNNDLKVVKPMLIDEFMWQLFPYTLIKDIVDIDLNKQSLRNIAMYTPIINLSSTNNSTSNGNSGSESIVYDTSNSLFYYQSFHKIAQIHLQPVYELLQWLQVMSSLDTEESMDSTRSLLQSLNAAQILKATDNYNYELEEHTFKSSLRKKLSAINKAEGKREVYVQEKQISLLALPTVSELVDVYSKSKDATHSFQPFLPVEIEDQVAEIHDKNIKAHNYSVESEPEESNEESEEDYETDENQYNAIDKNDYNDENDETNNKIHNQNESDSDNDDNDFNWDSTTHDENLKAFKPDNTKPWTNGFEENPW